MTTEIRVRYEETDRMGVAYYGNYFVWFEVARTDFFREIGFPYVDLEKKGFRVMVVEASCSYKSPATYDDLLKVETKIRNIKNTSLDFIYKIHRDKLLVASGETTHVFTTSGGKPTKIPEDLKKSLTSQASL